MGSWRSFGDLGRTGVMDLDAGQSRAPADILGDDRPSDEVSAIAVFAGWQEVVIVDLDYPNNRWFTMML